MNRVKIKLLIIFALLVLLYVCFVGLVYSHELGHKAINANFGFDSYVVLDNFGLSGQTIIEDLNCGVLNRDLCLSLFSAQSAHESFSYTVLPVVMLCLCLLFGFIVFWVWLL